MICVLPIKMIDIHAHILPSVDDGAANEQMALEMLRTAEAKGTKAIIATPHVIEAYNALSWQEIVARTESLQQLALAEGLNIKIYPGAELEMNWELLELINEPKKSFTYCLAASEYILVELPASMIPSYAEEFWFELRVCGLRPILAHPERHMPLMQQRKTLDNWKANGLLLQCNAGSLTGLYGTTAKKNLQYLLDKGYVDFLASDAHNNARRHTDMSQCPPILEELVGSCCMRKILFDTPQEILLKINGYG